MKDIRRPQLGKWFFEFGISKPGHISEMGWYHFRLCCFKLLEAPKEGGTIKSTPHQGFVITFLFWFPLWF